jgi:hypothetical protein
LSGHKNIAPVRRRKCELIRAEFVIGRYTVGGRTFDAPVFGFYEGGKLIYVARTRNGFTPALRDELMRRFSGLETPDPIPEYSEFLQSLVAKAGMGYSDESTRGDVRRSFETVADFTEFETTRRVDRTAATARVPGTGVGTGGGWHDVARQVRRFGRAAVRFRVSLGVLGSIDSMCSTLLRAVQHVLTDWDHSQATTMT